MKRKLEIESCAQCPHLKREERSGVRQDGGYNCSKLLKEVPMDRGGRHVSDHVYNAFRFDFEKYEESQHGMFPRTDRPRDPFIKLWVDNCPLEKA